MSLSGSGAVRGDEQFIAGPRAKPRGPEGFELVLELVERDNDAYDCDREIQPLLPLVFRGYHPPSPMKFARP